jgi:hypothetical protein
LKKLLFAGVGASILVSAAAASAQGLPAGTYPQTYGSAWTAGRLRAKDLNTDIAKSGQSKTGQQAASITAERNPRLSSKTGL